MIIWSFRYFKMYLLCCIFMSVFLGFGDGLTVKGSSGPLVVPLGGSVLLPCSVDSLVSLKDLEVQWKRSDSHILIHLYEDGDIRPEVQHEDYRDRAHFFTDNIKDGNFSLMLMNVTDKDEGQYTCTVHSGQESGETVLEIQDVERLIVSGSDQSISVYVGEDVTLNCSVDSHIPPEHIEEVSWKKIVKDEHITVLLYESNKTLLDASDTRYRDRVEFFSDEIHRGNFSLRLKRVRSEDKGVYMCQVFAGRLSDNTTVTLEQLGFSSLHILVLILCVSACGSALLLFCSLIYCRSNNTDTSGTLWKLQISLVVCPNVCVFSAFLLWGFIEGFVNETVTCCALYILRTVMLFWAVRFLKYLQGSNKTWIRFFSVQRELGLFSIIVYSVFFACGWKNTAHYTSVEPRVLIGVYYGFVVLLSLSIMKALTQNVPLIIMLFLLTSSFQELQILFSFRLLNLASFVVPSVKLLLAFCVFLCQLQIKDKVLQKRRLLLIMMLLDIPLSIYFYLVTLEREKDYMGWISVISFIQALKMIVIFQCSAHATFSGAERQQDNAEQRRASLDTTEMTLPLCSAVIYMFGAVGLVLLNSAALMTELVLKARTGERVMKDLRLIVFPSECVFALSLLVLQMHAFWCKTDRHHDQNNLTQRDLENTEAHELETLSAPDTGISKARQ